MQMFSVYSAAPASIGAMTLPAISSCVPTTPMRNIAIEARHPLHDIRNFDDGVMDFHYGQDPSMTLLIIIPGEWWAHLIALMIFQSSMVSFDLAPCL
jgi:hypothetical protein